LHKQVAEGDIVESERQELRGRIEIADSLDAELNGGGGALHA